jgi:CheY-like chemotaxis protein
MAMSEPSPIILLVEDNADTIRLIRLSLLKAGFANKVLEAHDGEQAIEYLLGEGKFSNRLEYPLPQVVFLDLKMPRMNGLDFLKWLRTWPPGRVIPVVVLTTSVLASDLSAAYDAGANSYLVKGVDAHELVEQVTAIGSIWLTGAARLPQPPDEFRPSH